MVACSPRIPVRLRAVLAQLDDDDLPIAEVCRRVGAAAARLGLPQPSYEQVRILVHQARRRRRRPTATGVFLDVAFRIRPPDALLDQAAGIGTGRSQTS